MENRDGRASGWFGECRARGAVLRHTLPEVSKKTASAPGALSYRECIDRLDTWLTRNGREVWDGLLDGSEALDPSLPQHVLVIESGKALGER
jgi:hypothetical protein